MDYRGYKSDGDNDQKKSVKRKENDFNKSQDISDEINASSNNAGKKRRHFTDLGEEPSTDTAKRNKQLMSWWEKLHNNNTSSDEIEISSEDIRRDKRDYLKALKTPEILAKIE